MNIGVFHSYPLPLISFRVRLVRELGEEEKGGKGRDFNGGGGGEVRYFN